MNTRLAPMLAWLEHLVSERRHLAGCFVVSLIVLPLALIGMTMHVWALLDDGVGVYYRALPLRVSLAMLACIVALVIHILLQARHQLASDAPRLAMVRALSVGTLAVTMLLSVGYGLKDTIVGSLLISLLLVFRTFFTVGELMPAFVVSGSLLLVCEVLVATGTMPYAPLLAEPLYVGHEPLRWWVNWSAIVFNASTASFAGLLILLGRVLARLRRQLSEAARIDSLTGTLNRRAFMDILQSEAARQTRHGRPGAVLMLDLDHFKRINDSWGHHAGDAVLMHAAALLKLNMRPPDVVARLGGEEFAVLLPESGIDEARVVAERLRVQIAEAVQTVDTHDFHVTASIGVAPVPWSDTEAALRWADAALYEAKRGGRNRVVVAGTQGCTG